MPNADRRTILKMSVAGAGAMIAAPSLGAQQGRSGAADFDHLTVRHRIAHGITVIHALAQGVVWTLIQCGEYEGVLPHIELLKDAIYTHGMAAWIPVADTYSASIAAFLGQKPDPACL